MKIAILGAGALGCYYGARLQESGQDVSFIVRSEYDYLKEHGLEVKSLHGNISLPRIKVYREASEVGPVDLVVVAWKSTANAGFAKALPPLMGPDTVVATLQNGMGNAEEIARIIPSDRIYVGLCFICAMREGDFTTTGHYIVLRGVKDGEFQVNDPNSVVNSEKLWSYEQIEGQIRNLWVMEKA